MKKRDMGWTFCKDCQDTICNNNLRKHRNSLRHERNVILYANSSGTRLLIKKGK